MIAFDPASRTFNLSTRGSYYTFRIDDEDRIAHGGWGVRPTGSGPEDFLTVGTQRPVDPLFAPLRSDEVLTFGDAAGLNVTLKVEFAAPLPGRDLRLRYARHEVDCNGCPGNTPQHGQPVRDESPRETLRVHLKDEVHQLHERKLSRLSLVLPDDQSHPRVMTDCQGDPTHRLT